jgi:hypothetical protein
MPAPIAVEVVNTAPFAEAATLRTPHILQPASDARILLVTFNLAVTIRYRPTAQRRAAAGELQTFSGNFIPEC